MALMKCDKCAERREGGTFVYAVIDGVVRFVCSVCADQFHICIRCSAITDAAHVFHEGVLCGSCCPDHAFWVDGAPNWAVQLARFRPANPPRLDECPGCDELTLSHGQPWCHRCQTNFWWCEACVTYKPMADGRGRMLMHGSQMLMADGDNVKRVSGCAACLQAATRCLHCAIYVLDGLLVSREDRDGFKYSVCIDCSKVKPEPCAGCKFTTLPQDLERMPEVYLDPDDEDFVGRVPAPQLAPHAVRWRRFDPQPVPAPPPAPPRYCGVCRRTKFGRCENPGCLQWTHKDKLGLAGPNKLWCQRCHKLYKMCPVCFVNPIRKDGEYCRTCIPIDPNHQANPLDVTGFLGIPDDHQECLAKTTTKKRAKGRAICLPTCKFDRLFMGVELEVEVPYQEQVDADVEARIREENAERVRVGLQPRPRPRRVVADESAKKRMQAAMQVKRLLGKQVILKHDGSLANGFEIVTGPAPLDYHRTKLWRPLFAWQADTHSLLSHDAPRGTCGLHVHLSKDALTPLQVGKMVQFLHAPENYKFIRYLAGRPSNSRYADYITPKRLRPHGVQAVWAGGRVIKSTRRPDQPIYSPRRDTGNRYTGLNLANRDTVEFRIFRGTLNSGTFFARLEFCHALAKFSQPGLVGLAETTVPIFTQFLNDRKKDYPNLLNYLVDGEFVPAPRPKKEGI